MLMGAEGAPVFVQPKALRVFTAAGSARTGEGVGRLVAALEEALTTDFVRLELFVPFAEDLGVTSGVLTKGVVSYVQYREEGTLLACRVPISLADSLKKFETQAVTPSDIDL